ncbi:ABC transporter substrate-binding protein [Myxococcota bacterium]
MALFIQAFVNVAAKWGPIRRALLDRSGVRRSLCLLGLGVCLSVGAGSCSKRSANATPNSVVLDSTNRLVSVPQPVKRLIGSGAGCLRYITYLQSLDQVIAVDEVETRRTRINSRPYAIAHPELRKLPVFGGFMGRDNPELIATLDPAPELILKTFGQAGHNPAELQEKTGIPVFVVDYGDLVNSRGSFYNTLRIMGKILGKTARSEEIIRYFDQSIVDLAQRTSKIPVPRSVYVGGVSFQGPLGFRSTQIKYPPFVFTQTKNLTLEATATGLAHIDLSKEQIVTLDPEVVFIDLATLGGDPRANALHELKTDSAYESLRALKSGEIYGLLPYAAYAQNYGSTLANAYFVGKVLYPKRFSDIDPMKKADEIYTFLVGAPVFPTINDSLGGLAFKRLN